MNCCIDIFTYMNFETARTLLYYCCKINVSVACKSSSLHSKSFSGCIEIKSLSSQHVEEGTGNCFKDDLYITYSPGRHLTTISDRCAEML